jgi:predicted nucleic acid-binding Zn ribbon protein
VRRSAPRPLSLALGDLRERLAPATPLASVQRAWPEVAGPAIASEATPVSERSGVVTVSCRSAVWAQELDLMAPQLVERLNDALGAPVVASLRCVATGGGIRR